MHCATLSNTHHQQHTRHKSTYHFERAVVSDDEAEADIEPLSFQKDWWQEIKAAWSFDNSLPIPRM